MPSNELQAVMDAAVDAVILIDHVGLVTAFNRSAERDQALIDRVQQALARDQRTREGLKEHGRIRARIGSLTPREHEVLELLASVGRIVVDFMLWHSRRRGPTVH